MLFLDTNAFYYAAGISTTSINLPELLKLISENETCISVVSLHEFLVKFRNDIGVVKKGLQFLADHHSVVLPNGILSATGEQLR